MSDAAPRSAPAYTTATLPAAQARDLVLSVWRANLRHPDRHGAKFEWGYRGCPFGEPLLQLLRHESTGAWVGSCTLAPRRMEQHGQPVRAGVLVDMAVAAAHRSLGPAMIMQEALLAAAQDRFDLAYGFPNAKSLPVVKRLGYAVLGYMPRYSRVLHHRHYLERHVPRWLAWPMGLLADFGLGLVRDVSWPRRMRLHATWSERADPRMDALWQASDHGDGLIAPRDTTFLRWRFDQAPIARTRYLLLSARPDGPLLAWFACRADNATLTVHDFWSIDAGAGIGLAYVRELVRSARRAGLDAVSIAHAAPRRKLASWLQAGFVERERRPVVGRWLGAAPEGDPVASSWHLTVADEDE